VKTSAVFCHGAGLNRGCHLRPQGNKDAGFHRFAVTEVEGYSAILKRGSLASLPASTNYWFFGRVSARGTRPHDARRPTKRLGLPKFTYCQFCAKIPAVDTGQHAFPRANTLIPAEIDDRASLATCFLTNFAKTGDCSSFARATKMRWFNAPLTDRVRTVSESPVRVRPRPTA
jgi:hypothetical protein